MQNKLSHGYYSISEAASLIAFGVIGINDVRLRNFFKETKRYDAAVESDRTFCGGKVVDISFLDLMELRAISYFRNQGSSSQALRVAAAQARKEFGPYPFSRRDVIFYKEGRKLLAHAAEQTKDSRLLNLVNRQFEFELVKEFVDEGVKWDVNQEYPEFWHPNFFEFPEIAIDPRVSFGRPSVIEYGVETETIHSAWIDTEGDYGAVADWFEVPEEKVRKAVRFQSELPN